MPNAVGGVSTNPTLNNPAVTLANGVLKRGDGIGAATDQFVFDLGQQAAFANAAITTVVTGSPTTCTVVLQGSIDGKTWNNLATSTSTTGDTQFSTGGTNQFGSLRVNVSNVSGGTSPTLSVGITAFASNQGGATAGTTTVAGTVTANQGTKGSLANAWPVQVTDGTNTMPTMDTAARAGSMKITDGTNTASVNNAFGGNLGALRTQLISSSGGLQEISGGAGVAVGPAAQSAANILSGNATAANTASAQTVITIPATRTWVGTVSVVMTNQAATGTLVTASVATAGTGVTPAAATVVAAVQAGSVGTVAGDATNTLTSGLIYVTAPGGNSVTLTLTNSTATTCTSQCSANGLLL